MNSTIRRLLAAVALKQAIDRIRGQRRPKRRLVPHLRTAGLLLGVGGGLLYYLLRSGRLSALVGGVKGRTGQDEYSPSDTSDIGVTEGDAAARP